MNILNQDKNVVKGKVYEGAEDAHSMPQYGVVEFLKFLYPNPGEDEYLNIRPLPNGKNLFIPLNQIDSILTILETCKNKNLYFAACSRKESDGKKKGILRAFFNWLDMDGAPLDKVMSYPLEPSVVWETSPGHYQVAYRFREPLNRSELRKIENILKRLAIYFEGDLRAIDSSRILRLPGSLNLKYEVPFRVRVIYLSDSTYELSDFDNLLPTLPKLEIDLPLAPPTLLGLSSDPDMLLEDYSKRAELGTRNATALHFLEALCNAGVPYKEGVTYAALYAKRVNLIGKGGQGWHEYTPKQAKATLKWVYQKGPRGPSVRQIVEWIEARERNLSELFHEKKTINHETTPTVFNNPCGKGTFLVTSENRGTGIGFRGLCHRDDCAYCSNLKKEGFLPRINEDFIGGANISIIKPGDREAWEKAAVRAETQGHWIYSGNTETVLFMAKARVKESFRVSLDELRELVEKYFQKEEKSMNGKQKFGSFGFEKEKREEFQFVEEEVPKHEERKEKKLVFFIPCQLDDVVDANRNTMTDAEKIIDIKNEEFCKSHGVDTNDIKKMVFSESTQKILREVQAMGEENVGRKKKPAFKVIDRNSKNPFEKAIFLGKW